MSAARAVARWLSEPKLSIVAMVAGLMVSHMVRADQWLAVVVTSVGAVVVLVALMMFADGDEADR